jgi:hypothetical protein
LAALTESQIAVAQAAPPLAKNDPFLPLDRNATDELGVSAASGGFQYSQTISIGPENGGLSYTVSYDSSRRVFSWQWAQSYRGSIYRSERRSSPDPLAVFDGSIVSIGPTSEHFLENDATGDLGGNLREVASDGECHCPSSDALRHFPPQR